MYDNSIPGFILMGKDELTTGLEADGCLGTSNPDLIIFSIGKQKTSPIASLYQKG